MTPDILQIHQKAQEIVQAKIELFQRQLNEVSLLDVYKIELIEKEGYDGPRITYRLNDGNMIWFAGNKHFSIIKVMSNFHDFLENDYIRMYFKHFFSKKKNQKPYLLFHSKDQEIKLKHIKDESNESRS